MLTGVGGRTGPLCDFNRIHGIVRVLYSAHEGTVLAVATNFLGGPNVGTVSYRHATSGFRAEYIERDSGSEWPPNRSVSSGEGQNRSSDFRSDRLPHFKQIRSRYPGTKRPVQDARHCFSCISRQVGNARANPESPE